MHGEEGLEILGVAFVEGGERGRKWLAKYMAERSMTWTNVMAGPEWYGKPLQDYDVSFLPFQVLLDRDGRVAEVNVAPDRLEETVRALLSAPREN